MSIHNHAWCSAIAPKGGLIPQRVQYGESREGKCRRPRIKIKFICKSVICFMIGMLIFVTKALKINCPRVVCMILSTFSGGLIVFSILDTAIGLHHENVLEQVEILLPACLLGFVTRLGWWVVPWGSGSSDRYRTHLDLKHRLSRGTRCVCGSNMSSVRGYLASMCCTPKFCENSNLIHAPL